MLRELKKEDMDHFLYEVGKAYKKLNRNNPNAEIVLVGGAAVSIKYDFRSSTTDIDAIISAGSTMKEVIQKVAEDNELSGDWLNQDFKNTDSYSPKLSECSKFYKTFCQCLTIRTVEDEYLIAMKLCSARQYKQDMSDIVGIIKEMQERGKEINYEIIDSAMQFLYNGWDRVKPEIKEWLKDILSYDDLEQLYYETRKTEKINKKALLIAQEDYKDEMSSENADSFINAFREKAIQAMQEDDENREEGSLDEQGSEYGDD